jgi:hypothetical protein
LDVLLKFSPDHLLLSLLARCGLSLPPSVTNTDDHILSTLRIVAAIERAATAVRDCVVASLRRIARLVDAVGRQALRRALWAYLHHRELFDAAVRLRETSIQCHERMPLEVLREPLPAPDGMAVNRVCLFEATLLDEATGGEIAIRAPADDARLSVLDLLDNWMPIENPMRQGRFRVIAAKLGIEFFPEPGQMTGRSVLLALKRRGGSNLSELDAGTRAQCESWLRRWWQIPGVDAQVTTTL